MAPSRTPAALRVPLTKSMQAFLDQQVAFGESRSAEECVRDLIRRARKARLRESAELESKLQEALDSGPAIEMDAKFWARKTRELRARFPRSKRTKS